MFPLARQRQYYRTNAESLLNATQDRRATRRPLATLAIAGSVLCGTFPVAAADFRLAQDNTQPGVPILVMSGEIQAGDANKLVGLLKANARNAQLVSDIWLNSPGGNLNEAIKIGAVVEELGYTAVVPIGATCASACFFVWISAPGRLAPGAIIVHRPYYNMRDSMRSAGDYEEGYRAASETAGAYLRKRNVPADLIELILTVPSSDGYTLSDADKTRIGPMSAARMEYMIQNCGFPDASESRRIMAAGGFSEEKRKAMRECGLQFYAEQKNRFFSGAVKSGR